MLSFNPTEVILTIVNFLLLYFLLKHFLFDPVTKFTDARDARVAAAKAEEKDTQEALDAAQAEADQKRSAAEAEAQRIRSAAHSEDLRVESAQMRSAEDRVSTLKKEKMDEADARTSADEAAVRQNADSLAAALAEKLLNE